MEERFRPPNQIEPLRFSSAVTRDLRPLIGNRQLQALWVMTFVIFFGWSAMWPIMTYFVQYIGVPLDTVAAYAAYVMFVSGTVQTGIAPLFGHIGDRVGHRRVLILATLICGIFIIPHYFIQTYPQFFVMRIIAMAAGAAIHPAASALVAHTLPRSRYGGAYGVLASSRGLAGSIGPIIGGSMARYLDIRLVFIWTGIITILAAAWGALAVEDPPQESEEPEYTTEP